MFTIDGIKEIRLSPTLLVGKEIVCNRWHLYFRLITFLLINKIGKFKLSGSTLIGNLTNENSVNLGLNHNNHLDYQGLD